MVNHRSGARAERPRRSITVINTEARCGVAFIGSPPSGTHEGAAWLNRICGASSAHLHQAACSSGCSRGISPAERGHKLRLAPSGGTVPGRKQPRPTATDTCPVAAAVESRFTSQTGPTETSPVASNVQVRFTSQTGPRGCPGSIGEPAPEPRLPAQLDARTQITGGSGSGSRRQGRRVRRGCRRFECHARVRSPGRTPPHTTGHPARCQAGRPECVPALGGRAGEPCSSRGRASRGTAGGSPPPRQNGGASSIDVATGLAEPRLHLRAATPRAAARWSSPSTKITRAVLLADVRPLPVRACVGSCSAQNVASSSLVRHLRRRRR